MMLLFTLKILLAHLLGDFVLQPKKWVDERHTKGIRSKYLYAHIAVHLVVLLLLFVTQLPEVLPYILLVVVAHYLIDLGKIYAERQQRYSPINLFVADQLLHLLVIAVLVMACFDKWTVLSIISAEKLMAVAIALIVLTAVSSIAMKVFFSKWSESFREKNKKNKSLKNAGNIIGITERLLIVLFICVDFWGGIGYLLAAKSIFRFGDLTRAKDRKLTEYILSGTLISFTIAIVVGVVLRYALIHL